MRREALLILLLLSPLPALGQSSTAPAQMGITPATVPEVLQVLDNTKTWVNIGSINAANHLFTFFPGGSLDVTQIGMKSGGADNFPLVSTLMNTISSAPISGGPNVIFPGVIGQSHTVYYFSNPLAITRGGRYICSGGAAGVGSVELAFPAGVDGVVQDAAALSSDGGYGWGSLEGCSIVSMGYGGGHTTPGASAITNVGMAADPGGVVPASTWSAGDGVIATPGGGGVLTDVSAVPAVKPGAWISGVAGSTLNLASGFTSSSALPAGDNLLGLYQLPASQTFSIVTTVGSGTANVVGGPRKIIPGEVIWSDAFPLGTTVWGVSGPQNNQTITLGNSFYSGPNEVATVTHASGSPGKMWVMPAGLRRSMGANSSNNIIQQWPIGLKMNCTTAFGQNCTGSYDFQNYYQSDLVGRWTGGSDTSASSSINEKGANNYWTDYFNGAVLGETAVNFNANSAESGRAPFGILGNCTNQNFSGIFGGYIYPGGGNSGADGGCAKPSGMFPPTKGYPGVLVGLQVAAPGGAPSIGSNNGLGLIKGGWYFVSSTNGCVDIGEAAWAIFSFSYNGCDTVSQWGVFWNTTKNSFDWTFAANYVAMRWVSSQNGYKGYAPSTSSVVLPIGVFIGGLSSSPVGQERFLDFGPYIDGQTWHLKGDTRINNAPSPGGNAMWSNAQDFITTLSGPVTGGTTTSAPVAACPSPALPAGTLIVAQDNVVGPGIDLDRSLGTLASCTGTTLTLQAAAAYSAINGATIQFLRFHPAGLIANDTAGNTWTLGYQMTLRPELISQLPPCPGNTGMFAVVSNGAAPTYGGAVGATGAAPSPVFCDGAGWKYH